MNSLCRNNHRDSNVDAYPTVWARVAFGYRIENLQTWHIPQILEMIKMHYVPTDTLMLFTNIAADSRSVEKFLQHCESIMLECCSLLLIDEQHNQVAGCLLLSVVDKMDFGRRFSCMRLNDPENYTKFIEVRNQMQKKVDYFRDYGVNTLMRFYLICINKLNRGRHFGFNLFRAGLEIARHFYIPLAVTFMSNSRGVEMAKQCGFETVEFIEYNQIHDGPKILSNNYVALMVAKVPPFYTTPQVRLPASAIEVGKRNDVRKSEKTKKRK